MADGDPNSTPEVSTTDILPCKLSLKLVSRKVVLIKCIQHTSIRKQSESSPVATVTTTATHLPAAPKLGVVLWSRLWDNSHTRSYKKDFFPSKIYYKEIMQQRHKARCNLHLIDSIISNNLEVF